MDSSSTPVRRSARARIGNILATPTDSRNANESARTPRTRSRIQQPPQEQQVNVLGDVSPINGNMNSPLRLGNLPGASSSSTPSRGNRNSQNGGVSNRMMFENTPRRNSTRANVQSQRHIYNNSDQGVLKFSEADVLTKATILLEIFYDGIMYCNLYMLSYYHSRMSYRGRPKAVSLEKRLPFFAVLAFVVLVIIRTVYPINTGLENATTEGEYNITNNTSDSNKNKNHDDLVNESDKKSTFDDINAEEFKKFKMSDDIELKNQLKELAEAFERQYAENHRIVNNLNSLSESFVNIKTRQIEDTHKLELFEKIIQNLKENEPKYNEQKDHVIVDEKIKSNIEQLAEEINIVKKRQSDNSVEMNKLQDDIRLVKTYTSKPGTEDGSGQQKIIYDLEENLSKLHAKVTKLEKIESEDFLNIQKETKQLKILLESKKFDEDTKTKLQEELKQIAENLFNKMMDESVQDELKFDFIEDHITGKLRKLEADKIGIVDYALESAGGKIEPKLTSYTYKKRWLLEMLGLSTINGANFAIQSTVDPGNCWPMSGASGFLGVKLSEPVSISHFTIDHIPYSISRVPTALKEMKLWGLNDIKGPREDLGFFEYDFSEDANPIQTFPLEKVSGPFKMIQLEILNNHGHNSYTCLYRIRIHGDPVSPIQFKMKKKPSYNFSDFLKEALSRFLNLVFGWES